MKTKLPVDDIKARMIKDIIYKGSSQERAAALAQCDQSTISRIVSGKSHSHIPWPNGKLGGLPIELDRRARGDSGVPWSEEAVLFQSFPHVVQDKILSLVNSRRVETGLTPIVEMDPTYEMYITAAAEAEDSIALHEARDYEDARIVQVMTEFHEIQEREIASHRAEEALIMLSTTSHFGTKVDEPPPPEGGEIIYSKLSWDDVVLHRDISIIQEAEKGDQYLQEACCIVFFVLKNSERDTWKGSNVEREIRKIAERLRGAAGKTDELYGAGGGSKSNNGSSSETRG